MSPGPRVTGLFYAKFKDANACYRYQFGMRHSFLISTLDPYGNTMIKQTSLNECIVCKCLNETSCKKYISFRIQILGKFEIPVGSSRCHERNKKSAAGCLYHLVDHFEMLT